MHSKAKNQADAPISLREKYDFLSESWYRIDRAVETGAIRHIAPNFRVRGRRIYDRAQLDLALAERKFGDDLVRARKHRDPPCTTLPAHLAPPVPQPGALPFERVWTVGWAEHKALARLNKPSPTRKLRLTASPPLQWALTYEIDEDGEFKLTGGMARAGRKTRQGGDQS